MDNLTDQQLICDYAANRSEAAFAELTGRHVDLVYSAAMRLVRDAHLAKDVTQGVFLALAQNAPQLTDRAVIASWLHFTTRNLAVKTIRSDARRRAREQEAAAMNELLASQTEASWEQIAPQLDDALVELSEPDRDAVVLRYFQRKSAEEMAAILGISAEAAQKRVNRAVERLRDVFAKRGVVAGTGGLAAVVAANAVQAAPAGLAASVSTAATMAGTTAVAAAATKIIAMTTLQKTLVGAALAITVTAGIFEARQASHWRGEVATLQEQQARQVAQLQQERDDATNRLASLTQEIKRTKGNSGELLRLRSRVTQLQTAASVSSDPFVQQALKWKANREKLKQILKDRPEQWVPEMKLLGEDTWLDLARDEDLDTPDGIRKVLSEARHTAKNAFVPQLGDALKFFVEAHGGMLPDNISELKPYFEQPVDDAMLDQYKMVHTGKFSDVRDGFVATDKQAVDPEYDVTWKIGPYGYGVNPSGRETTEVEASMETLKPVLAAYSAANNGNSPATMGQLKDFVTTPEQQAAYHKLVEAGMAFPKK